MESTVGAGARKMRHDENLVAKSVAAAKPPRSVGNAPNLRASLARPVTVLGSGRPQVSEMESLPATIYYYSI